MHYRLLDSLPAATKKPFQDSKGNQRKIYEDGFPLGQKEGDRAYLNNHIAMTILYHDYDGSDIDPRRPMRIVGFEVVPDRYGRNEDDANIYLKYRSR